MPDSTILVRHESETARLAERIARLAVPGDILLISGPLGAGKSSFARSFIRAKMMDPALDVPSPTFTLVQSYQAGDVTLWHYDLWRLTGPEDLEELAWDEAQLGIILVEWPDRLGSQMPRDSLEISISHRGLDREITLRGEERWFHDS